jgi:hypothetical protein
MFEPHSHPLLDRAAFFRRVLRHSGLSSSILAIALGTGVVGYHFLGGLDWIDALLNASMILGGMGPINALDSPAAKLFASGYALFAGLVFVAITSVFLAPFAHRLLHRFHGSGTHRSS